MGKPIADDTVSDKLDLDFISFGAMSNLKTMDVFSNAANNLADYDGHLGFFVSKNDSRTLCSTQPGCDYGLILKIHPHQFPQRTWIACAGVGEWGTSGSTWFLANRWAEIAEKVNESEQFVCVIQVTPGQDESSRLHYFRK